MKNYYRQFVTLLQERPGHAMPGKQAVGRIVIEARDDMARATVYIQDLAPQNTYKLAFINRAGEENLGVVLGAIIVDERGRYEGKFEFDRAGIGGSRITCEGIDACVVFLGGGNEEFEAPLAGYRLQPFSWRVNLSFSDGKENSPILEVKQVEESAPAAPVEVVEETQEEVGVKTETEAEVEEVPPPVYDFIVEEPVSVPAVTQAAQEPIPNDEIAKLFENEDTIEIFRDTGQFPAAQWIVTALHKIENLEQIGKELLQNPFVKECCEKHKHILIGRHEDGGNVYILGIPDVYDTASNINPNVKEFCDIFDSFKLCNPNDPVKGSHGYWLKKL